MSYNKINYNNFVKILKIVFKDTNIRHEENYNFILLLNISIYKKKYMEYINYSRDIILLSALKTIIEEYDFLVTKIDNNTLLYSKEDAKCIITSKSNNIDSLYNYLKYLNSEFNRIVNDMENNLHSIYKYYYNINVMKTLYLKEEIDNFIQTYNNLINNSFYQQHLYFCVKFMLCNLSCIKVSDDIDKDLIIQRNLHHLFYVFDKKEPSNPFCKFLLEYKDKFNTYLFNYCKANDLLDDNEEIKYIIVEDFLINDFFEIVYFDKKITDYYEGCHVQLNGIKNPTKTADKFFDILQKKNIKTVKMIIDS